MTTPHVAFRADASARIGSGHVRRCLSLAKAVRAAGAEISFVHRDLGIDAAIGFRELGARTIVLPPPQRADAPVANATHAGWAGVPQEHDASETATRLGDRRVDWLVVDHYAFGAPWHEIAAARLGCRIAAIDDLGDRALQCDLVVDHNHHRDHASKYRDRVPPGTRVLGGPHHALIDPVFATAPRYAANDEVRSIGIFMGGMDAGGHAAIALNACRLAGFGGPVEVVSTGHNPAMADLRDAVVRDIDASLSLDLSDLAAFFARHDLQVGAGGGATWERCCIGAPSVAVVVAENQRSVLEPLAGLEVLETSAASPDALAAAVRSLLHAPQRRRDLSANARRLVDGRGTMRVAKVLLEQS